MGTERMTSLNRQLKSAVPGIDAQAAGRGVNNLLVWGLIVAVWGALLYAFRPYVEMVLVAWETLPSHAHGYVVLMVVAYLLWTKREHLAAVVCRPSWKGFVALAFGAFVAMVGELTSVAAMVQFALVLMIFCTVWAIGGDRAGRVAAGPLSFLVFAVPFGQEALPILMNWTADATVVALRHSGVPVFQEGRNFVIPSGRWSVIEACGGIRYLLSSVFIGAVFAYLTYTRVHKRVLFMVWSVIMPLLANWLRAYVIVMVAHHTDNEWGMGVSHLAFGWIIFGIAVFIGFAVGVRWRDPLPEAPREAPAAGSPLAVVVVAAVLAAVIPPGVASTALAFASRTTGTDAPKLQLDSLADLERDSGGFEGVRPSFPGARAIHQARYKTRDGEIVDVFVAYFRNQQQGAELINVSNKLDPTHDWSWAISSSVRRPGTTVPEVRLEGYVKSGRHAAAYQLYWVNDQTTANDTVAKLLEAVSRLRGHGDDSAAIILTMYSTEDLEAARLKTEAFAAERLDGLLADLRRTAEAGR